ncbi:MULTISPECIES: hypothetical protein [Aedoeadaptatus]|uniref:DUF1659 domain-containing protein n=1 Tax=Aedoeadaptatus acetigenes TaxID=2981723 RepID=A0ABV1J881_9FIRM|nr:MULTISPECIES: hypothetical protein [Peptoniphilaceae]MCU6787401.1 hypothetical protein [Aedoeadaptatus acetigenes]
MTDIKKSLRLVYLETDSAGKSKRRAASYSGLLPEADNAAVKKAADAFNTLTQKPADAVEIITTETLV